MGFRSHYWVPLLALVISHILIGFSMKSIIKQTWGTPMTMETSNWWYMMIYSFCKTHDVWHICHRNCPCRMMRIKYTRYHVSQGTSVVAILRFSMGWWLIPTPENVSAACPLSQVCRLSDSLGKFRFKTSLSRRYRLVSQAVSQIASFLVDFIPGCSWLLLLFCFPSFVNCKTIV